MPISSRFTRQDRDPGYCRHCGREGPERVSPGLRAALAKIDRDLVAIGMEPLNVLGDTDTEPAPDGAVQARSASSRFARDQATTGECRHCGRGRPVSEERRQQLIGKLDDLYEMLDDADIPTVTVDAFPVDAIIPTITFDAVPAPTDGRHGNGDGQ